MSLKRKNIIIIFFAICALAQILAVKNILPKFHIVSQQSEEFWYDISLAFFTGALVYAFTSGWSSYIIKGEQKKIIVNELQGFLSYSIERLESIDGIDFSKDKDAVKSQFKELTYGSKAKPNATNTNTIYSILEKINKKKESLYQSCIPVIQYSNDTLLLAKVYTLLNSKIFNSNNVYKSKEFKKIENHKIDIGSSIYLFYSEVKNFKKTLE